MKIPVAIVSGVAVLGAAVAGITGVSFFSDAEHHSSEKQEIADASSLPQAICLNEPLPYFEASPPRCLNQNDIRALFDVPLVNAQGERMNIIMAHPSDFSVKEVSSDTCKQFLDLSWENWYPMTGRDQRRHDFFVRACGVLKALSVAKFSDQLFFADRSLSNKDLKAMMSAQGFGFGEKSSATEFTISAERPFEWTAANDGVSVVISEIAIADFDNDAIAEILLFVRLSAPGGSAASSCVGFANKDTEAATTSFSPYFP